MERVYTFSAVVGSLIVGGFLLFLAGHVWASDRSEFELQEKVVVFTLGALSLAGTGWLAWFALWRNARRENPLPGPVRRAAMERAYTLSVGVGSFIVGVLFLILVAHVWLGDEPEVEPPETVVITVDKFGPGVVSSLHVGFDCGEACPSASAPVRRNDTVSFMAPSSGAAKFIGWIGCDSEDDDHTCTVTANADRTVLATFASTDVVIADGTSEKDASLVDIESGTVIISDADWTIVPPFQYDVPTADGDGRCTLKPLWCKVRFDVRFDEGPFQGTSIEGSVMFRANPVVAVDFDIFGLKELRAVAEFTASADVTVAVISGDLIDRSDSVTISLVRDVPLLIPVGATGATIPVTLDLNLEVGIEGSGEARFEAKGLAETTAKVGSHYVRSKGWEPIEEFGGHQGFDVTVEARGHVKAFVGPRLTLELTNLPGARVFFGSQGYVQLEDSPSASLWQFVWGLMASVGIQVDFLGFTLAHELEWGPWRVKRGRDSTPTPATTTPPPTDTPDTPAPTTPPPTDTPDTPAPTTPSPTATPDGPAGDVDCDGDVTSLDALFVHQLTVDQASPLPCQKRGEVNCIAPIDSVDADLILQLVVASIDSLDTCDEVTG